jgi:hypothetical protein
VNDDLSTEIVLTVPECSAFGEDHIFIVRNQTAVNTGVPLEAVQVVVVEDCHYEVFSIHARKLMQEQLSRVVLQITIDPYYEENQAVLPTISEISRSIKDYVTSTSIRDDLVSQGLIVTEVVVLSLPNPYDALSDAISDPMTYVIIFVTMSMVIIAYAIITHVVVAIKLQPYGGYIDALDRLFLKNTDEWHVKIVLFFRFSWMGLTHNGKDIKEYVNTVSLSGTYQEPARASGSIFMGQRLKLKL